MVSQSKEHDRKTRILIMQNMAAMMRLYAKTEDRRWADAAKELGETAKLLSERIRSHNYSQEDIDMRRVNELEKKWKSV